MLIPYNVYYHYMYRPLAPGTTLCSSAEQSVSYDKFTQCKTRMSILMHHSRPDFLWTRIHFFSFRHGNTHEKKHGIFHEHGNSRATWKFAGWLNWICMMLCYRANYTAVQISGVQTPLHCRETNRILLAHPWDISQAHSEPRCYSKREYATVLHRRLKTFIISK